MAIGRDAVAAVLLDLAESSEGFKIEVEAVQVGHGIPVRQRKRRRAGSQPVPTLCEVTRAKLIDAAKRLRRGEANGVLADPVTRLEASFRLVLIWTGQHQVIVRGRDR